MTKKKFLFHSLFNLVATPVSPEPCGDNSGLLAARSLPQIRRCVANSWALHRRPGTARCKGTASSSINARVDVGPAASCRHCPARNQELLGDRSRFGSKEANSSALDWCCQ